jgi:hypothetical protein
LSAAVVEELELYQHSVSYIFTLPFIRTLHCFDYILIFALFLIGVVQTHFRTTEITKKQKNCQEDVIFSISPLRL